MALIMLLAVGVPLLLLSGGAAVAMVLTDTGGGPVTDGAIMVMPSREPLGDPSAQDTTDPATGQTGQDAAGQVAQNPDGQTVQDPAGQAARDSTGQTVQDPAEQTGQDSAGPAGQDPAGQTGPGSVGQTGQAGRGPVAVGEAVTLAGRTPGLQMSVTVNQLVAAATPASDLLKPKAGAKLVAVQVTLVNTSQAVYGDAPSNGAWLIDTQGQQYRSSVYGVREGQSFGGSTTINAGDSRKGMIVFEVPEGAVPAKFQFALDSGYAEQKGEWTLS
ncbi:DUF4352 domain-containing protein [Nonomuraea fuscirosea]|uniref:DUF4352 domain-containing protein n=1 Tax=Nonomuraea fuscirosea TaxID=1291556 RepID=UPI003407D115